MVTRQRTDRRPKGFVYSVDQWWKGIDPDTRCMCGGKACEHFVTIRRGRITATRSVGQKPCKYWQEAS